MLGRVFLGRYQTIRLIGEGGMGRVYLAHDNNLGRDVVVKIMHDHIAADPKFRDRFTRETLVMTRFQHPYAVTLYDASLNDPQGPCIVMEYIKGVTLDSLVHPGTRLFPARVGRLLGQLGEVLHAAHAAGIVHRDLKPANLMIVDPGESFEMLKVMDFGLAKLLAPDPRAPVGVTNTEFAVGTPGYMCPEQARGEAMDHRGDIYSVGVILYELLTGRLPFAGKSTMDILLAHATEPPPSFARSGASGLVSPAIEDLVQACLAKDPADRPASARELAQRFEAALVVEAAPEAPPPPGPPAPPGPVPRATPRLPGAPRPKPAPPPDPMGQTPPPIDPLAVVHTLEAWMPEKIAACKLRGFIHDVGGEVQENVPGRIRVRLGNKGCIYTLPIRSSLSWLGLGRRAGQIDLELRLERAESRENQLRITVVLRSLLGDLSTDLSWRQLCTQIFCDLRAYLMGQNGPVRSSSPAED
jgi:serine/threonine-protein kinase